jgi:hypothetical protein
MEFIGTNYSLKPVKLGGWLVKVSLFNEVFLLHAYNESSIDSLFKVFYNEDDVVNFMEKLND